MQISVLTAGNSIFSINGLPYQYSGNDIYSQGMGDVGIGDGLRLSHGFGNPALINTANTVNFYTGIKMGYIKYEAEDGSNFTDNALDFPFFSIVAPFDNHRFAFQFNSWKSGNFDNEIEVPYTINGEEETLTEQNLFNSYIYKLDAYYGYRLASGWSLAIGPNVYIGNREQELIQDSDSGTFNTKNKTKISFTDIGFTAGILKQGSTWSLGANYEYGRKIDAEKEFYTIHSNEELGDVEFNLPHKIGFGLAKKWAGSFKIASDINYEIWDSFMGEDYHNSWKAGIGFAYEPKLGRRALYKTIPIRAGFSLRELPFDYNNEKIYEKSASVGFSLPLKSRIDKLDFAFEYLVRGDVDTHGIEDRSSMFMIGVSGFDIFRKVHSRIEPRDIPVKEDLN
jgi:hypothetical protein